MIGELCKIIHVYIYIIYEYYLMARTYYKYIRYILFIDIYY